MNDVSVEVMVERAMLNTDAYVLFAARHQDGAYVRVKSAKAIDPVEGEMYRVRGKEWHRRDANGRLWRQIDAYEIERICMSGALIGRWLERLPHVGEVRAQRLIDAFPNRLAEVLSDVQCLPEVAKEIDPHKPVLANKIATQIYSTIAARNAKHPSLAVELDFFTKLENLGVTDDRAARSLWRLVGGVDGMQRLLKNPYLAASLMSWSRADHLGKALLKERAEKAAIVRHPDRLLGAVDSAWRDILAVGNTAATHSRFRKMLERKNVDVDQAIALAIDRRHIVVQDALYRAPGAAWIEEDLAARLRAMEAAEPAIRTDDFLSLQEVVYEAEAMTSMTLHDEQRVAVQMLLALPVGVLQGGAGVGKTTVMKVLVTAWERLGGNVLMGALAGKAALQLSRGTSTPARPRLAYTVTRALRMLGEAKEAALNEEPPKSDALVVDSKTLLILDEASMLDTPSVRQVLALLPPGARLLLVGDRGQLPPVGIGRVFHDLVEDGTRVVTLTKVRRTAEDSPVPVAAALVRNGHLPALKPWNGIGNGIFWIHDASKIYDLYSELLRQSNDVMVVAALRASVNKFNEAAAARRRVEVGIHGQTVRLGPLASVAVGDPVVCTQNRYKEGLFNGLLGRVTEANAEMVRVLWDGESEPREVSKGTGADIELAYAITCHRAQGSAARYVIVMVEDSPIVTREWLYTAVTRTRETVILVGSEAAIQNALARRSERVTGFAV